MQQFGASAFYSVLT